MRWTVIFGTAAVPTEPARDAVCWLVDRIVDDDVGLVTAGAPGVSRLAAQTLLDSGLAATRLTVVLPSDVGTVLRHWRARSGTSLLPAGEVDALAEQLTVVRAAGVLHEGPSGRPVDAVSVVADRQVLRRVSSVHAVALGDDPAVRNALVHARTAGVELRLHTFPR